HTGDAATLLPEEHVSPKHALPTACADDLISKRRARESAIWNRRNDLERFYGLERGDGGVRVPVSLADETDERVRHRLRNLCEINRLESVTARLQRRVPGGQEWPNHRRVILRPDLVLQGAIVDRHEPAFL